MMKMTLTDADIIRLLPLFMRKDRTVKALAAALNPFIRSLAARLPVLGEWNAIDRMNDAELNELAYEYHIEWFDKNIPVEQKRDTIKSAIALKEKQGTKWAVKEAVKAAYSIEPEIKEWFEYSGSPGCFRVTLNVSEPVDFEACLRTINYVKRESAHLDYIEMKTKENSSLYIGHANAMVSEAGLTMDLNDVDIFEYYTDSAGAVYTDISGNKYVRI